MLLGFAAARGGPSSLNLLTLVVGAWASGYDLAVFTPGLPWAAVLLYLSGVAWTLGYDTVYALQDIEDDALAGVKSSARRLGPAAPRAILAFYALSVGLAVAAGWAAGLGVLYLAGVALFAVHLARQALAVRLGDPAAALAIFKSNTLAGLLLFCALVAGHWRP